MHQNKDHQDGVGVEVGGWVAWGGGGSVLKCNHYSYHSSRKGGIYFSYFSTKRHIVRTHYITRTCLFKYIENFISKKLKNFRKKKKKSDIFHISAQNTDCGYSLEPPL